MKYSMLSALAFISACMALPAYAGTPMGGTVRFENRWQSNSRVSEVTEITLECEDDVISIDLCRTATLITKGSRIDRLENGQVTEVVTGTKYLTGELDSSILTQEGAVSSYKRSSHPYRREGAVEAFNEATSLLGKIVLGVVEYPRLGAIDLARKQELNKYLETAEFLINPASAGQTINGYSYDVMLLIGNYFEKAIKNGEEKRIQGNQ